MSKHGVRMRPYEVSDSDFLYSLLSDEVAHRYVDYTEHIINREQFRKQEEELASHGHMKQIRFVLESRNGVPVGCVWVAVEDLVNRSCTDMGIVIGPKYRMFGYGPLGGKALHEYVFDRLNLHAVIDSVEESNVWMFSKELVDERVKWREKLGMWDGEEHKTMYFWTNINRPGWEKSFSK